MTDDERAAFLSALVGTRDWGHALRAVEVLGAERRTADLAALGAGLVSSPSIEAYVRASVHEAVVRALASIAEADAVTAALALVSDAEQARRVGAMLAATHGVDVLAQRLAASRSEARETIACWAHELVLRGHDVSVAAAFFRALGEHPLAHLPLAPRAIERGAEAMLPRYAVRGHAGLGRRTQRVPVDASEPRMPAASEVAIDAGAAAVFAHWVEASNGRVDLHAFVLSAPSEVLSPTWLRSLAVPCLDGATAVSACAIAARDVMATLIGAAANGGAYSHGLDGAYARRVAWSSLAALVGAPNEAPLDAIESRADACLWLSFEANAPFFDDLMDVGLACLRDDRRTLVVLAATDTD